MNIDWNKAPAWANYAAQDADGAWYWYENKPYLAPGSRDWDIPHAGDRMVRIPEAHTPSHAETLQERPEAQDDRRQEQDDRRQEQFDLAKELLLAGLGKGSVTAAWQRAGDLLELREIRE